MCYLQDPGNLRYFKYDIVDNLFGSFALKMIITVANSGWCLSGRQRGAINVSSAGALTFLLSRHTPDRHLFKSVNLKFSFERGT
jgi:hypothetical protein